jgi:hypothetical protein
MLYRIAGTYVDKILRGRNRPTFRWRSLADHLLQVLEAPSGNTARPLRRWRLRPGLLEDLLDPGTQPAGRIVIGAAVAIRQLGERAEHRQVAWEAPCCRTPRSAGVWTEGGDHDVGLERGALRAASAARRR